MIKLRYLIGVTAEMEPLRKDMVKKMFPAEPAIPIKTRGTKSRAVGILNSKNNEIDPQKIITKVKKVAIK